jgi:hypothetical protein
MDKVRLYLDVDGVINAQMPFGWGRLQRQHVVADESTYRIRWAPRMVEALGALDLEIVWLTSWRQWGPLSIAPAIGLGADSRVLHPNGDPDAKTPQDNSIYWKIEQLEADQSASPSRFIWVDDEINDEPMIRLRAENLGGLAISANDLIGITPKNIEQMQEYINAI